MKITMQDGRSFQGTALQIVQSMQSIAFVGRDAPLADYIAWVARTAGEFEGVGLDVVGATDEEKAESLVTEMVRKGLASRG